MRAQLEQLGYGVESPKLGQLDAIVKRGITTSAKRAERAGIQLE